MIVGLIGRIPIPDPVVIIVSTLVTIVVIHKTILRTTLEVDGNKIVLTYNPLWTTKLASGQTLFNVHGTGFHVIFLILTRKIVLSLESRTQKITNLPISAKNGDLTVNYSYRVRPDSSSPEKISIFASKGKDENEIWETIQREIVVRINRTLESVISGKSVDDVLSGKKEVMAFVETELQQLKSSLLEDFGIVVEAIKIGNVDLSAEASRARDDQMVISLRIEAARQLVEATKDGSYDMRAALRDLQVDARLRTAVDLNIPQQQSSGSNLPAGGSDSNLRSAAEVLQAVRDITSPKGKE